MLQNLDPVDFGEHIVVKAETTVQRQRYEEQYVPPSKPDEEWTAQDLRYYVVAEIERRFGKWERDYAKEAAIFKRFHTQWGAMGVRMARYVFDSLDGWWQGSPVKVTRFCKAAEPHFAIPLAERLRTL